MTLELIRPVLVVMVKNEILTLPRLLKSVEGKVSGICITDTGSDDGTRGYLSTLETDVPLVWGIDTWVNFGHNRNLCLQRAYSRFGPNEWFLLADADWTLIGGMPECGAIPPFRNEHIAYSTSITGHAMEVVHPTLIHGDQWRWTGAVHESLVTDVIVEWRAAPFVFHHHGDGGARAERDDIGTLSRAVRENPGDARSLYYLGRTYFDQGMYLLAQAAFTARAMMVGTWEEERWHAELMAIRSAHMDLITPGRMTEFTSPEVQDVVTGYLRVYGKRAGRPEPLYWLSELLRHYGEWHIASLFLRGYYEDTKQRTAETDVLFPCRWMERYGIATELAICDYYIVGPEKCGELLTMLLEDFGDVMPDYFIEGIRANLRLCYPEPTT